MKKEKEKESEVKISSRREIEEIFAEHGLTLKTVYKEGCIAIIPGQKRQEEKNPERTGEAPHDSRYAEQDA